MKITIDLDLTVDEVMAVCQNFTEKVKVSEEVKPQAMDALETAGLEGLNQVLKDLENNKEYLENLSCAQNDIHAYMLRELLLNEIISQDEWCERLTIITDTWRLQRARGLKEWTVKIYDFIGDERIKQMKDTIGYCLQSPREDLEFVCDTDIPGFDMHKTLGGYEIACDDVDYMKLFTTDDNHPVIVNSNKCTLAADRLIGDHRYNMIYISSIFRNYIRFNQETLFDKIFVKVIKENNVLNVILSADPDSFIEPSIDQYEKFVDPKKLIEINALCVFDFSKYLKVDSITLKSIKYSIIDSNIKKIQFRKPGFMKYTIPVKPHSTIMISTKRYSDTEVFLTASINGVPQSFMQRLDKETTNVDIRIDCKKDIIKFILL